MAGPQKRRLTARYLVWRDGRPRWEPGPGLRAMGATGRDLKDEAGNWLDLGPANRLADQLTAAAGNLPKPEKLKRHARSCNALYDLWTTSPGWATLADATRRDYASKASVFLAKFGDAPVAAVEMSTLHDWWEKLFEARGHAMANGIIAVVRAMLSYGRKKGWITDNPARELGLITVPPRVVVWHADELVAMVATADRLGHAGVGDAVVIAAHSGQRLADVLSLTDEGTANGRVRLRQHKTRRLVSLPPTDQLAARLDAARRRRTAGQVVAIAAVQAQPIVLDKSGTPYTTRHFNTHFRAVRDAVATAHPAVADKLYLDLRDTAVTRLALAGCTLPEICAITGHNLASATQVLKHYLAQDERMADAAIAKLKAWITEQGIAI